MASKIAHIFIIVIVALVNLDQQNAAKSNWLSAKQPPPTDCQWFSDPILRFQGPLLFGGLYYSTVAFGHRTRRINTYSTTSS